MSNQDRLLSDEELLKEVTDIEGHLLSRPVEYVEFAKTIVDLINTQKRLHSKSELEKFKANNHIGYAYEPGEVTENYIVLERVVKKGKNWVLRVKCRWCGNEMNRMTNKFNMKHIDCKNWDVNMKLSAKQKARIK